MPVKNICPCDLPPGGQTICEPHQLAICFVSNGVANKQCIDPPINTNAVALCNWTISEVTGVARNPINAINSSEVQMLESGRCVIGNQTINFSLPPSIQAALAQLNQKGQGDSHFMHHD